MQEVIDAEDSNLKELRSRWGEAVYNAVVNALLEVNEIQSKRAVCCFRTLEL